MKNGLSQKSQRRQESPSWWTFKSKKDLFRFARWYTSVIVLVSLIMGLTLFLIILILKNG